jgi:hypothetical protein
MILSLPRWLFGACCVWSLLFLSSVQSHAEKHALLIGIGKYADPVMRTLYGPDEDIPALRNALTAHWDFEQANIMTLQGPQATKRAILDQLHGLQTRTSPGDTVLVYFSGHGVSRGDPDARQLSTFLDSGTGGLFPYDFVFGDSKRMLDSLLLGKRDIVPLLRELEQDRQVFAVFDACFSGYTVRGRASRLGQPIFRFQPLPGPFPIKGAPLPAAGEASASGPPAYSLKNVVYLSASSAYEKALDLPSEATHDKKPHGALTDALLVALREGGARGGAPTYRELHANLMNYLRKQGATTQTPELHYQRGGASLVDAPALAGGFRGAVPRRKAVAPSELTVVTERLAPEELAALRDLRDVRIVAEGTPYDVRAMRDQDGAVYLVLSNGATLCQAAPKGLPATETGGLLRERLQKEARINRLLPVSGERTSGDVFLWMHGASGYALNGAVVKLRVRVNEPSYLLLLSIGPDGVVRALYPANSAEAAALPARYDVALPGGVVKAPLGVETLIAYAFDAAPQGLERFMHEDLSPLDDRFQELCVLLETLRPTFSTATLLLKSCDQKDIETSDGR